MSRIWTAAPDVQLVRHLDEILQQHLEPYTFSTYIDYVTVEQLARHVHEHYVERPTPHRHDGDATGWHDHGGRAIDHRHAVDGRLIQYRMDDNIYLPAGFGATTDGVIGGYGTST